MRPCLTAAHDDAARFDKDGRLRYKFDKALDFDLFEIVPPLEVLLQNRKDKAASIARESAPQALAHGGEHDDQVHALVNLILGLVVERIAPQEVYYVSGATTGDRTGLPSRRRNDPRLQRV